ncbi:MAG: NAAT family transporter [Acidobacteriaceae bacterium]|nr:NAAT family transporter [Acidobacteriaceae bacterium]
MPKTVLLDLLKATFLVISALFPIVNPLGGSPIFLSLTGDYTAAERHALSRLIAMNSFFLLIGSYLIGTHILDFFGISLPVVQVGGGLVVISTGWTMLQRGANEERKEVHRNIQPEDQSREAFYPFTLPLTVGPGSISVAITLGANAPHGYPANLAAIVGALIGSAAIGISVYLCYAFADRLARMLGPTGMTVIVRLTSFLLVCIGVQILWNGLRALLASVPLGIR